MRAVSLFSNCGAGDIGFHKAGFRFDVLAEIDPRRLAVAALNHPGAIEVCGDIRHSWPLVVDAYRKNAGGERLALLSACPPCQGMSSVRNDRGPEEDLEASSREHRNLLVVPIIKIAIALQPRIIVVENVPAFLRRLVREPGTDRAISAARLLTDALSNQYEAFPVLCDLADFGVPQTRKRAFITMIRRGEPALEHIVRHGLAPFPKPSHSGVRKPETVKGILQKAALPALDARRESSASYGALPLHFVPVWDARRYAMVAAIPAFSGRSAWENTKCLNCGADNIDMDLIRCVACDVILPRPIVTKGGKPRLISGFRSSSYRRMRADRPAATITTASGHLGSSFTIHPWENRLLSPMECAILQTFPRKFKWGETLVRFGVGAVRDMIGEAVPPLFTTKHGRALMALLNHNYSSSFLSIIDVRCLRARKALSAPEAVVPNGLRSTGAEINAHLSTM